MVSEEEIRAVANTFAAALDRSEFGKVATLLTPTCRYDTSTAEGTLVGPDEILDSYRSQDARAHRLFDRVDYSSVVEAVEGRTAVIRFTDVFEKAGQRHTYSCRQRITVSDSVLIDSLVHEDIPAERAAVQAFMERLGVTL